MNVPSANARKEPLIRKIEREVDLTSEERRGIYALPLTIRTARAGQEIVREGDKPSQSCLVITGLLGRLKIIGDQKRSISSYHISGDIPDFQSIYLPRMDHSLEVLKEATVALVPHSSLLNLILRFPRIGAVLWRITLVEAAIFREWLANNSRRDAHARLSHLFCELLVRAKQANLSDGRSFDLLPTQTELGDASGLSIVHVNRVMRKLTSGGIIAYKGSRLDVLDWQGLKTAGDFDAGYLHLAADETDATHTEQTGSAPTLG